MNALHGMDRYWKEVIQVSTQLPQNTSFESIHLLAKRATPSQMSTLINMQFNFTNYTIRTICQMTGYP